MTALIVPVFLVLLALALERSHRRRPYPRPRLYGSTDLPDADEERVRTELRHAADRS